MLITSKNFAGRSTTGKITVRSRVNMPRLCANKYAKNQVMQKNWNVVCALVFNKKRGAIISLLKTASGSIYINTLTNYLYIGSVVYSGFIRFTQSVTNLSGHIFYLYFHFIFHLCVNIVISLNAKFKLTCAAGTYSKILEKNFDNETVLLTLPSTQRKRVSMYAIATQGRNSFFTHKLITYGKAGKFYMLGFKSTVRGVAKNAVDHPNGGRTKSKQPEKSP